MKQWIRSISLKVQINQDGDAIDLSEFRIRFTIKQAMTTTPGAAEIRIYNLSEETEKQLINLTLPDDQYQCTNYKAMAVQLEAGYEENRAQIFLGELVNARRGRESPTDTFVEIIAQCGDLAHNFAVVNTGKTPLPAGWSPADHLSAISKSYEPFGISLGDAPPMSDAKFPRGRVMYGMAWQQMDVFAKAQQLAWGYSNGQLVAMPLSGNAPVGSLDQAIVLNSASGLIGLPQLTSSGLLARCLLNPSIRPGGQIKLDNKSIQMVSPSVAYGDIPQNILISNRALDADGYYKVYCVQHMGDTRGQIWYTDTISVGVNASQKPLTGPVYTTTG